MIAKIEKLKSALVLIAGLLVNLLNEGVIPHPFDTYVGQGLAILTTLGVVAVNAPVIGQSGKHDAE